LKYIIGDDEVGGVYRFGRMAELAQISGQNAYAHLLAHAADGVQGAGREFAQGMHSLAQRFITTEQFAVFGQHLLPFAFGGKQAIYRFVVMR
jgi:hypothetical protein